MKKLFALICSLGFAACSIASSVPASESVSSVHVDGRPGLIEKIQELHAHSLRMGWFKTRVVVKLNEDPEFTESPGYLVPNFERSECTLYVSPKAIVRSGFDGEFNLKFMVFHETAHCDRYMDPSPLVVLPSAGRAANLLLSDLVQLEFLHASAPNRLNGYNVYQETYADVKAFAVLRLSGASAADLFSIVGFREGNAAVLDTHHTQSALRSALAVGWEALSKDQLEARVQSLSAEALVDAFFNRTFRLGSIPFVTSSLIQGALRQPLSAARFRYSDPADRAFTVRRIREILASGNPAWETFAKLELQGIDSDLVVSMYFEQRYGLTRDQIEVADREIAVQMLQRAQPPVRVGASSSPQSPVVVAGQSVN